MTREEAARRNTMQNEHKYIDAVSAATIIAEKHGIPLADLVDTFAEIPAADVVEVVRCCNCEFHDHDGTSGYCNYWRRWSNMSDFCSHGK